VGARVPDFTLSDQVCFTAQSVPLAWTVTLHPLDLDRAKR
jgi:hypothetical protein